MVGMLEMLYLLILDLILRDQLAGQFLMLTYVVPAVLVSHVKHS